MTLILEGIPSAGGPRSRRARWALASSPAETSWLVTSARGLDSVEAAAAGAAGVSPEAGAAASVVSPSFFSPSYRECQKRAKAGETPSNTYTTGSAGASSVATTAPASASSRGATASALTTRTFTVGCLSLLASWLGLASKLNGNLAFKDLLAREGLDSTLGLSRGREVDKGIANRTVGAWVLRD